MMSRPRAPPPLSVAPAVRGPRQRKTKTRAEETAAGAPPENPGQKARASHPRCPAAHNLAPAPTGWPRPGSPSPVGGPCAAAASSPYLAQLSLLPLPCKDTKLPQRCPPTGRSDPSSDVAPGPALSPGGVGAPGAAGSRPGRRRLHSSGRSGSSAARALLGARAGAQGAGAGNRGAGPKGDGLYVAPPTYSHPAPQATLHTRLSQ